MLLGLCLIVLTVACSRGPEPPRPSISRAPSTIGVVIKWDWLDCTPGQFTLATGEIIAIADIGEGSVICDGRQHTPTPLLSENGLLVSHGHAEPGQPIAEGDLLLYGEDEAGSWYAAANQGAEACPYQMSGGAYDEGEVLHFSSGLVLEKAPTFQVVNDWVEEPFPLRAADQICLNELGEVISVQIWLPY